MLRNRWIQSLHAILMRFRIVATAYLLRKDGKQKLADMPKLCSIDFNLAEFKFSQDAV